MTKLDRISLKPLTTLLATMVLIGGAATSLKAQVPPTEPPDSSPPASENKTITFTFTSQYDYSSCIDDILLLYEGRLYRQGENSVVIDGTAVRTKSQCIDDVLALYGNKPLSQQEAYYLIDLANFRATNLLAKKFYPPLGVRRRVAMLIGFIYEIDKDDYEIRNLAAPSGQPNR